MHFDLSQATWLSAIGAIYDIAGAYLLSKALFAVKPTELIMQASSGYGGFSTPLLRMFCEQKVDSRFGLVLLIGGFILQALSSAGMKLIGSIALALLLPAIGVVVWYKLRGASMVRKLVRAALETRFEGAESERLMKQAFEK
jgi:hypothetical protein